MKFYFVLSVFLLATFNVSAIDLGPAGPTFEKDDGKKVDVNVAKPNVDLPYKPKGFNDRLSEVDPKRTKLVGDTKNKIPPEEAAPVVQKNVEIPYIPSKTVESVLPPLPLLN